MSRRSVTDLPANAVKVWSSEDTAALLRDVAAEPIVIGSSVLLDLIVDHAR